MRPSLLDAGLRSCFLLVASAALGQRWFTHRKVVGSRSQLIPNLDHLLTEMLQSGQLLC